MSMRRLEEHAVASPPSGAVALSVARHITETAPHPDVALLHARCAKLIHSLVDVLSLEVKGLGRHGRATSERNCRPCRNFRAWETSVSTALSSPTLR
jgi:hypothetical protein